MNPVLANTSAEVARIAFSLFVYVADIDRNISAQEVRRFQVLLNDTAWVDNIDLKAGLLDLKDRYSSFWANYEDGVFATDAKAIAEALERVQRYIGDERGKQLKIAFGRFLVLLDRGSFGVKLGQKDNPARIQAKKELATILLGGKPPTLLPAPGEAHDVISVNASFSASPAPPPLQACPDRALEAETVRSVPEPDMRPSPPPEISAPIVAEAAQHIDVPSAMSSHPRPDEGKVWPGRIRLRCVSVVAETHDTKTYSFVGEPGTLFHYRPGQAITIEVPIQSRVLRRSYTISSSPSRPYLLSITVKKVAMGWMSNWLYDNMVPGVECMASGPFGKFSCLDHAAPKMLFLAAGSGVTPLMSMLRWLADMAHEVDVVFIYNVSTPADIIFHQELLHLATRFGHRLRLVIVPVSPAVGIPWQGSTGRLSDMLIRSNVPDLEDREVFVCGPAGYMAAAKALLLSAGLPEARYHQEAFGSAKAEAISVKAPSPPPVPAATAPTKPMSLTPPVAMPVIPVAATPVSKSASPAIGDKPQVLVESTGHRFAVSAGQTILEAAEESGISLEHSCRAGNCGACKMRRVSGEVHMAGGHCLSEDEVNAGHILTCIAQPSGTGIVTLAG